MVARESYEGSVCRICLYFYMMNDCCWGLSVFGSGGCGLRSGHIYIVWHLQRPTRWDLLLACTTLSVSSPPKFGSSFQLYCAWVTECMGSIETGRMSGLVVDGRDSCGLLITKFISGSSRTTVVLLGGVPYISSRWEEIDDTMWPKALLRECHGLGSDEMSFGAKCGCWKIDVREEEETELESWLI